MLLEVRNWVFRLGLRAEQLSQLVKIEREAREDPYGAFLLDRHVEVELDDVPVEVDVFGRHLERACVFYEQRELIEVESLYELVVVGELAEEDADLFEDSHVQDFRKTLAISDQRHAFCHQLRAGQFLQDSAVFDEVADVGQTDKSLLDHILVLFGFALPVPRILRRVLPVELQLVYRFADHLLKSTEKTLFYDELGVLRHVDKVGLDIKVANCIQRHQVHLIFELVSQTHHLGNHPLRSKSRR